MPRGTKPVPDGTVYNNLKVIEYCGRVRKYTIQCIECGKTYKGVPSKTIRTHRCSHDGEGHAARKIGDMFGIYKILTDRDEHDLIGAKCTICGSETELRANILGRLVPVCCDNCSDVQKPVKKEPAKRVRRAKGNHVKNSVSLYDDSFKENVVMKTSIQPTLYNSIRLNGVVGDSLIVAGPDIERHIRDARSTFGIDGSNITIVENNPVVALKQIEDYNNLKGKWMDIKYNAVDLKDNVSIQYGDIANVRPCRIIDADLMGTTKTDGPIVQKILHKQIAAFEQDRKALIFTLSERTEGGVERIYSWVEQNILALLECKCKLTGKVSINSAGKFNYTYKLLMSIHEYGRLIDLDMFHYGDSKGPMLTCCIIYK